MAMRRGGPSGRYLTEADESEILRRVHAGENTIDIGKAIGRPRRLVYVVLKRTGRPRGATEDTLTAAALVG
jgi:hypothetical protein